MTKMECSECGKTIDSEEEYVPEKGDLFLCEDCYEKSPLKKTAHLMYRPTFTGKIITPGRGEAGKIVLLVKKEITNKLFKIVFHGTTFFYGENAENAIDNFRNQAETTSEDFIIDSCDESSDEELQMFDQKKGEKDLSVSVEVEGNE